jgi:capsular exopolysaccharide synthesis family protein
VLWRARWPILALTIVAALAGVAYCLWATPTYRATASLLIEPKEANVVEIDKVYETQGIVREYHRTQYELLHSSELLTHVIEDLDLANDPAYADFKSGPGGTPKLHLRDRILQRVQAFVPQLYDLLNLSALRARRDTLLGQVLEDTKVDPVPNTYLVKVSFESDRADLSARVANAIVETYMQRERAARTGVGHEAADMLVQRVDETRKALQASEQALQKFLEQQDLVTVGGGSRQLVEDDLTQLTSRLREAQQQKNQLANVYNRIRAAGSHVEALQDIPQIQEDPLVRDTKSAYLAAREALDQLGPRYGAQHPIRIAAQARYDAARRAYFTQLQIRADGIRSNYELAAKTEAELSAAVNHSTSRIQNLDRKDYDLKVLQRDVDSNRELYDTFLKRYKETQATADLELGSARIIDRATPPLSPTWPRSNLIVIGSAVLGLFVGCGLFLLLGILDDSVTTSEQMEALTGAPILCALPRVAKRLARADKLARLEVDDPKSIFAEGIRTLRTSVLLHDRKGKPIRKIMVCSSVPEEGKTSVASNLALVLAERERVLLIDADLRKPRLASIFKLPADGPGLTQVLTGEATIEQAVVPLEDQQLDVMIAGTRRDNPQILLASEAFGELLNTLSAHYDRIVFDTSPCQLVSDALLFARAMDAAIVLARCDSTPRKIVASTTRLLRQADAPVIGCVLNRVDRRRGGASEGGYYYRYGYYG